MTGYHGNVRGDLPTEPPDDVCPDDCASWLEHPDTYELFYAPRCCDCEDRDE